MIEPANLSPRATMPRFAPVLSAPGHDAEALARLAASTAPRVFIDLEFSVPEADKAAALSGALAALRDLDWGAKAVAVRVNGFETLSTFDELAALATVGGPALGAVLFPMTETAGDIAAVDRFLGQAGRKAGRERPLAIEVLIETPRALVEIERIAAASPRITALHFGPGDFAKAMSMEIDPPGTPHPHYGVARMEPGRAFHPADIWHYPLMRVAVTARAFGLLAFDGPYAATGDLDGYRDQCRRARALGCHGKWALSEAQAEALEGF